MYVCSPQGDNENIGYRLGKDEIQQHATSENDEMALGNSDPCQVADSSNGLNNRTGYLHEIQEHLLKMLSSGILTWVRR